MKARFISKVEETYSSDFIIPFSTSLLKILQVSALSLDIFLIKPLTNKTEDATKEFSFWICEFVLSINYTAIS
jgi:hypothetical protein